jgi:hypothetical protein
MQIFVTSSCPIKSAEALDDLRLNKMILELTQILSSSLWINKVKGPYKLSHENHPVVKWTSRNYKNYLWALDHLISLHNEREYRTGKIHKCRDYLYDLLKLREKIPVKSDTRENFVNCSLFKDSTNVIKAYRMTLDKKWKEDKRSPVWTNREVPIWSELHKKGIII